MQVGVYVIGSDGSVSAVQLFTINFLAPVLQSWTTIEAVSGEVPGFQRGGQITDDQIKTWLTSIAQAIAGALLRRGLPLDPTTWAQPSLATAEPSPTAVLEMINRLGSAARLAAALSTLSGQTEWAITKNLRAAYQTELMALQSGDYDKLFNPAAVSAETGQEFGGFTPLFNDTAFRKEKKF